MFSLLFIWIRAVSWIGNLGNSTNMTLLQQHKTKESVVNIFLFCSRVETVVNGNEKRLRNIETEQNESDKLD